MALSLAGAVVLSIPAAAVQHVLFVPDGAAVLLGRAADGSTRETCGQTVIYFRTYSAAIQILTTMYENKRTDTIHQMLFSAYKFVMNGRNDLKLSGPSG